MKIGSGHSEIVSLSSKVLKPMAGTEATKESGFGDLLKDKIQQVDELQKSADQAVTDFSTGKSKNLHEAILALEMADTSLRMVVTVRNKALEAYQEIMRMPV